MIHHVGIEILPADVERAVEFFELLGFEQVKPPPTLAKFSWLQHNGTQVHLMPDPDPQIPPRGHLAVVVEDFDGSFARLGAAGFEVERAREHWGVPRAHALAPGGHRVELMASPPKD